MKVFKFGGGILNSGEAVSNLPGVIGMFPGEPLLIVVSAFGKTTNALEDLLLSGFRHDDNPEGLLLKIKEYHAGIIRHLFPDSLHPVYEETDKLWVELENELYRKIKPEFSCFYDQLICYGELISSKIVSHFLDQAGFENTWLDIRKILLTDSTYRDASVNWAASLENTEQKIKPLFEKKGGHTPLVIIQGFIGSDEKGFSTSLGREGSDYTASIFANLLDANEVIIWKDVPGILNADPKHFRHTVKLDRISYAEATELAYYGAKVIHPKTIKPLQNKGIPMQVRSYTDPLEPGTQIDAESGNDTMVPGYIFKFDQILVTVSTRDLSFIDENIFNKVFALLSRHSIHMNIIQNSALTLSFCIDNHTDFNKLLEGLQQEYHVRYNDGLELITIRHFNEQAAELVLQGKQIFLEQHNRTVVQYVVR